MNIFYLYVAKKFWPPFFGSLGMFGLIVFLADMFEKMRIISRYEPSTWAVAQYFLNAVPFWLLIMVPIAVLLAGLFALSDLVKHGELTGAMSLGYRPAQIMLPIFICAGIVTVVNFGLNELAAPSLFYNSEKILKVDIMQRADWRQKIKLNTTVRAGDGSMLSMKSFDPKAGVIERVTLDNYSGGRTTTQTDAKTAKWDPYARRWIFRDGTVRTFGPEGQVYETTFVTKLSSVDIAPQELIIETVESEELNIKKILHRIKALEKTSSSTQRERTYLHSKIAAPFAVMIMCALGFPFAFIVKRGSKIMHFVVAGVIAFVFWWLMSVFRSAGEAGMMLPVIAGWGPLVVFTFVAIVINRKLKI